MSRPPIPEFEIDRFFDGELDPARGRDVYAYVTHDASAQRQWQSIQRVRDVVRDYAENSSRDVDFDPLWKQISRRIREQPEPSGSWSWVVGHWRGLGLGIAAVTAALLAVFWLNEPKPPSQANDCVIESLEVGPQNAASIFTIRGQSAEDTTTVIWVSELQETP